MRIQLLFIISVITFNTLSAQHLKAKVYDANATVKGIRVLNVSQKATTVTDANGYFELTAKVSDTIVFNSLFHHSKSLVLEPYHFDDITIFELHKIMNELAEVTIRETPKQPVFEEEKYNKDLKTIIQKDIKNNPHLYQPEGANQGVDFLYLFSKLAGLFKGKKKKSNTFEAIEYRQLDSLITRSGFFNDKLLSEDLSIPKQHKYLFLEFCSAKQIDVNLLKDTRKMELLEVLVQNSSQFLEFMETYETTIKVKE